eukprot:CFRG8441T1
MSKSPEVLSLAALASLDLALKLGMSSLRVAGAKGEGNMKSFFEKLHQVQLNTTDNVSILSALILYHHLRAIDTPVLVQRASVIGALSVYMYACRALDFTVQANGYNIKGRPGDGVISPCGAIGATGIYCAMAVLIVKTVV